MSIPEVHAGSDARGANRARGAAAGGTASEISAAKSARSADGVPPTDTQRAAGAVSNDAVSGRAASTGAVSTAGGGEPVTVGRSRERHAETRTAVGLIVALTVALSAVLAMFVGLAVNSGPNGVRLAVAGPPPAIAQITAGVSQVAGSDAFEISVVADEAAARTALQERTADGAIVVSPAGPMVLTAGAASPAVSQLLTSAAASLGGEPTAGAPVVDVVPLPAGDSRGVGLASGSLPVIIAGLALGAAAALRLRSRWTVLGTVVGGAVVIGLSFAAVFAWLGVTSGAYWAVSTAIALAVAASALVVAGLVRLMGPAGAGIGALLLVLVGNPLSGIATSPRLLPTPWGEIGQWLPTGAGGSLLRTAAYFPEASVWFPVLVLLGWAAVGVGMLLVGRRTAIGHGPPALVA